MDDREEWLPVTDYEGIYEVSSLGNVRSLTRVIQLKPGVFWERPGRVLRASFDKHRGGYPKLAISRDGDQGRTVSVHVLVAKAFLGARPDGADVCHNDGDPTNCRASNLRWGTRRENMADMVIHGTSNRGSGNPRAILTEELVLGMREKMSQGAPDATLARHYGVSRQAVGDIRRRKRWPHVYPTPATDPEPTEANGEQR